MAITPVGTPLATDEPSFVATRNGIALPAGVQSGHYVVLALGTANAHTLNTPPAGISQLGTTQASADGCLSLIGFFADGNEGGSVDLGSIYASPESGGTWAMAFAGVDPTTPINQLAQAITAASLTVSGPSVTPSVDGCMIVQIAMCDPTAAGITFTPDSSPAATDMGLGYADSGNWSYVSAQYYEQSTAAALALDGSYGGGVVGQDWAHFQIALNPASNGTITDVDGDNAVDQYQMVNANGVSGLGGLVISATLGGEACTVVDGDWQTNAGVVALGIPGNLGTGTYDLILSDGTDTVTLSNVSYTQTHARPAFDGLVDSNSILNGQSYTANTYFRFVTSFSNGTLDLAAGDAAEWAGDIADYYTPNGGFSGDDTATIEFLYSDGVTSAAVSATITVGASGGGVAPQGTVTIASIKADKKSAVIYFAYDLDDADGFEHSIDGGKTWEPVSSPIFRTNLLPGKTYTGQIRAVNASGPST